MHTGRWSGRRKEWSHAGHSLRIAAWYPRSEMAIHPVWYQGFVDGVEVAEGVSREKVRTKMEAIAEVDFAESGEFGQEEF